MQNPCKCLIFNTKTPRLRLGLTPSLAQWHGHWAQLAHNGAIQLPDTITGPCSRAHAHAHRIRLTDNPRAHGYPCPVIAKKGQA